MCFVGEGREQERFRGGVVVGGGVVGGGVAAETEADQDKAQREQPGKGETCTNSETDVDKELENRQQIQYKLSYCQMSVQLHSECFVVPRTQ